MSCFSPDSGRPKKPWRSLISALQKKVLNAKKSKSFNGTSCRFRYHVSPQPRLITGADLCVGSDDWSAVEEEEEAVDGAKGDVDANAEEFIEKMREYWKLERQKSEENYMEIVSRFYQH